MAEPRKPRRRDALSIIGMVAVAGAAAFTSYSGLYGLAHLAGWPGKLAMMLPVTVDAYAMTATRVWLSPARLTKKARAWARGNAIGAITTSVLGNALFHAAAAHVLSITWPVVVALSAIPPIALGLTVHLWHVADDHEPEPDTSPGPAIAEPETVRAAYPILGNASALGVAPASQAWRTSTQSTGALAAPSSGALRNAPSAPVPAGPSAPQTRPGALPAAVPAANTASARPSGPARVADRQERMAELRRRARELNEESIRSGSGQVSARKLARELHINQDTARELVREFPARNLSTQPSSAATQSPHPSARGGAPHNPAEVQPAPAEPSAPSAPRPMPASATAAPSSAPAAAGTSAPGTALPGPRTAPVEHANGAPVDTP
jgi:hypothetical protein